MKFDLALVSPPLKSIMGKYLQSAQGILALVVVLTVLGASTTILAPFVFSRSSTGLIPPISPRPSSGASWATQR